MKARLDRDPKARQALLHEALQSMIEGDVDTGKAVLCDHINATIGVEAAASGRGRPGVQPFVARGIVAAGESAKQPSRALR